MDEAYMAQTCRIYVTFTKEYLMAGACCIRLRDRGTGKWEPVLPNRLLGPVPSGERDPEFVNEVGVPRVGERLCLLVGGLHVVSTPILAIERAAMDTDQVGQLERPSGQGPRLPEGRLYRPLATGGPALGGASSARLPDVGPAVADSPRGLGSERISSERDEPFALEER